MRTKPGTTATADETKIQLHADAEKAWEAAREHITEGLRRFRIRVTSSGHTQDAVLDTAAKYASRDGWWLRREPGHYPDERRMGRMVRVARLYPAPVLPTRLKRRLEPGDEARSRRTFIVLLWVSLIIGVAVTVLCGFWWSIPNPILFALALIATILVASCFVFAATFMVWQLPIISSWLKWWKEACEQLGSGVKLSNLPPKYYKRVKVLDLSACAQVDVYGNVIPATYHDGHLVFHEWEDVDGTPVRDLVPEVTPMVGVADFVTNSLGESTPL